MTQTSPFIRVNTHKFALQCYIQNLFTAVCFTDFKRRVLEIIDENELNYLRSRGPDNVVFPFFAYFRNGIYTSIVRDFDKRTPLDFFKTHSTNGQWGNYQSLNSLLISYLSLLKKSYLPNLSVLDIFDEKALMKPIISQRDLKNKAKAQTEFCVFEGIDPDCKEYYQIAQIVAEDTPDVQFYVRESESKEESIWCTDRYYGERRVNYSQKVFNAKEIYQWVNSAFRFRNVQYLSKPLLDWVEKERKSLVLYVRDETEEQDRIVIDYLMQGVREQFNSSNLVFAVSDMKEGWHKEYFDGIEIFDEHIPLLMILDYSKSDRYGMYKFIYPANDYYTFKYPLQPAEISIDEVRNFVNQFKSNQLKPYFKNENLEDTFESFPQALEFLGPHVKRINCQYLREELFPPSPDPLSDIHLLFPCSLTDHACITDFKSFRSLAELVTLNRPPYLQPMHTNIHFYYYDYYENDMVCDRYYIPRQNVIRAYRKVGGVIRMVEHYYERLGFERDYFVEDFLRGALKIQ